jgi:hypothetical protein
MSRLARPFICEGPVRDSFRFEAGGTSLRSHCAKPQIDRFTMYDTSTASQYAAFNSALSHAPVTTPEATISGLEGLARRTSLLAVQEPIPAPVATPMMTARPVQQRELCYD